MKGFSLVLFLFAASLSGCSQSGNLQLVEFQKIKTGSQRMDSYLYLLKDKKVAVVANHASKIGDVHLIDTLLSREVNIVKVFSPEHGFRGKAEAGEMVNNNIDPKTKIPLISLYGNHKKPTDDDLNGIDIVVFDLQDVGTRFFTYISSLTYVMEACAENNIPVVILDRPNPNGFYVDGPILQAGYSSFIGLHSVPIVYGMTIGEYALMVNGENWLKNKAKCNFQIIEMEKYNHNTIVKLPIKPSPNLPNWESIYLYPSLCLFEGTIMSEGRGTDYPFQIYGHPDFMIGSFAFTPVSIPGGGAHNKFPGVYCTGQNLTGYARNYEQNPPQLNLVWLIESYKLLSQKHDYFNDYFDKLAGTDQLRKQIEAGATEEEIRESWKEDLKAFNKIREKYLLYD